MNTQPKPMTITLIGMPGVGKSVLGEALSERLRVPFVDTDDLLTEKIGQSIQSFIKEHGEDALKKQESDIVRGIAAKEAAVISTGGSVIYSESAMTHLSQLSTIIYLKDTLSNIEQRIHNLDSRGIVGLRQRSLSALYEERTPLYEKHARHTVSVHPFNKTNIIESILCFIKDKTNEEIA
jgi:shikimate kinase